jgi:hypothetical protein
MKKLVLAGISVLAVILLVLCSQTSVVGYRVVKDSQQNLIQKIKTNTLTLKNIIQSIPQKQGIIINIFKMIYTIIAFIIFIEDFVGIALAFWVGHEAIPWIFLFVFTFLYAAFWPISIPVALIFALIDLFNSPWPQSSEVG